MKRTDAQSDSFYHSALVLKEINVLNIDVMDTWTPDLKDPDRKDVYNAGEDIQIEGEELEPDRRRAKTTEDPTQEFVTDFEV